MAYRTDEVKVGFVLVVSILILAGFIIAILGLRVGRQTVAYTTSLKYVAGIDPGRPVRFGGMQVGDVTDVYISKKNNALIEIALQIEKGTPIKTDSVAFINNIGFVGDYYLEISTGSETAPLLPPGADIQSQDAATLNELFTRAQGVIDKLDASLGIVNDQLLLEEIPSLRSRLETTAQSLDKLLNDLDAIITENRKNINRTVNEITEILQENRQEVNQMVSNFQEASQKLNSLADMLASLVADNRQELDTIVSSLRAAAAEAQTAAEKIDALVSANADEIGSTVENLESTSINFRNLSEELADQPWRLLWRSRAPEKQVIREGEGAER